MQICRLLSNIESVSLYSEESFEEHSKEAIDKYEIEVKKFTKVSPTELSTIINNNSDIIVYFERGTCPYCQQFVPILTSISSEQNKTIYYIDTELTEANIKIQQLRKKYEVEYVPSLLRIYSKDNYESLDTSSEQDSLRKFIVN